MSSARCRFWMTRCLLTAAQGARVKPQLPITTVVMPWKHDEVPRGSQKIWASMWVWPSTKPGATTSPSASMTSRARSRMRPIVSIRPWRTPMSAGYAGKPDPSTTIPFLITRSNGIAGSSRRRGTLSTCAISYYECRAGSGRPTVEMKQRLVSVVVAVWVALLVAAPAYAGGGGGGGGGHGGGGHGGGRGFSGGHHGGHHHFHHRGRVFVGFVPFYAYPYWWDFPQYYYYPPVDIEPQPPVYIQQQPGAHQYWGYLPSPRAASP